MILECIVVSILSGILLGKQCYSFGNGIQPIRRVFSKGSSIEHSSRLIILLHVSRENTSQDWIQEWNNLHKKLQIIIASRKVKSNDDDYLSVFYHMTTIGKIGRIKKTDTRPKEDCRQEGESIDRKRTFDHFLPFNAYRYCWRLAFFCISLKNCVTVMILILVLYWGQDIFSPSGRVKSENRMRRDEDTRRDM